MNSSEAKVAAAWVSFESGCVCADLFSTCFHRASSLDMFCFFAPWWERKIVSNGVV